jgi:hypothetical protein
MSYSLTYDPICENEYNNFSQSLPMNKEHKMCMNNQICFTSSGEPLVISLGKSICHCELFLYSNLPLKNCSTKWNQTWQG